MLKTLFISLVLFFSLHIFAITDESEALIKSSVISLDFNQSKSIMVDSFSFIMFGKASMEIIKTAIKKLNDFLKDKPVKNYKVIHKGINNNNSFLIASFSSGNNSYRIHILANTKDKNDIINQIRIENNTE